MQPISNMTEKKVQLTYSHVPKFDAPGTKKEKKVTQAPSISPIPLKLE